MKRLFLGTALSLLLATWANAADHFPDANALVDQLNAAITDLQGRVTKLETGQPPAPTESAEGTVAQPGQLLYDALGGSWTINPQGQIVHNSVVDPITNSVKRLVYHNHQVCQNAYSLWWCFNGAWQAASDPTQPVTPPATGLPAAVQAASPTVDYAWDPSQGLDVSPNPNDPGHKFYWCCGYSGGYPGPLAGLASIQNGALVLGGDGRQSQLTTISRDAKQGYTLGPDTYVEFDASWNHGADWATANALWLEPANFWVGPNNGVEVDVQEDEEQSVMHTTLHNWQNGADVAQARNQAPAAGGLGLRHRYGVWWVGASDQFVFYLDGSEVFRLPDYPGNNGHRYQIIVGAQPLAISLFGLHAYKTRPGATP
jgi:hypothetical protein